MGYVGSVLMIHLRKVFPQAYLTGYDMGYFAQCLTGEETLPEMRANCQYFGDTRTITSDFISQFDTIVQLAAISNDPMGNKFEAVTNAINFEASASLASIAVGCGVKRFIFASSCSIYGYTEEGARTEEDELEPLTAYARSKVDTENALRQLPEGEMVVTSLRFATACGMSDRLRLDLVLNDFVACAITSDKISILSDGSPWRPLINVKDMARAIEWAITRDSSQGGANLTVNVGADESNFQVLNLAEITSELIPKTSIIINKNAIPDKRSYRVDFSLYRKLAPKYQPQVSIQESIKEIMAGLERMKFSDVNFRSSELMRLKVLEKHIENRHLDSTLRWI